MSSTCADSTLPDILGSVRRGDVVRVLNDKEASEPNSPAGHFVLAAETVSPDALNRLLRFTDSVPVFATTRDRLEQLRIVGARFMLTTSMAIMIGDPTPRLQWIEPQREPRLATAAASLVASDAELAKEALQGLTVCCIDWGGVANCQRVFEAAVDLCRLAGLMPAAVVCRIGPQRAAEIGPAARDELLGLPTVLIRQLVDHRRAQMASTLLRSGPPARLPTRHGNFTLQVYEDTLTGQLHLAFWIGELRDPALVRVHSECLTGDLFGSLRCDCGTQLDLALARLAQEGNGVLVYLRQEGRGIGLVNKLRTYAIQDQGFDTVEANEQIGFDADLRDYSLAAEMLVDLGVSNIRLLTNNPQKVRGLKKHGISVADRVPLVVEACSENSAYLDTKRKKLGHWLS